jgi:hypothetical protein
VAEPGSDVPPPHRKARSRRLVAFMIVTVICAAAVGVAWYWWSQRPCDGIVGQCFPAAADGPLDAAHGTVSCSDPNATWQIIKVMDGTNNGDVIGTCGPDGDALIYVAVENKSYCLDYTS